MSGTHLRVEIITIIGNCLLRFWLLSGNNIKIMDYRNADDPHIILGMNENSNDARKRNIYNTFGTKI